MAESLAKAEKAKFKKGQVIFNQGDFGDNMYIIESGKVGIEILTNDNKNVKIVEFGAKEFFGEMVLFGNKRRSATATALENTVVIIINNHILRYQFSKLPSWFTTMFKTLIERLRKTDEMMIKGENKPQKFDEDVFPEVSDDDDFEFEDLSHSDLDDL